MPKNTYELINEFRKEMNERFDNIESRYVTKDIYNSEVTPIKESIAKITWLVVSSVIIALLALVIKTTGVMAR